MFYICSNCGLILPEKNAYNYNGKIYCRRCLIEVEIKQNKRKICGYNIEEEVG